MNSSNPVETSASTSEWHGLLIILPVLNEAENITPLLEGIRRELGSTPHTVCVIDDGSTDGTVDLIRAYRQRPGSTIHLLQRKKSGIGSQRGSALRLGLEWGLEHTSHTVFVEMDGDLSHRPEELERGIRLVTKGGYDVAIASKYVDGSEVTNRPRGRRLVSWISSLAVGCVMTRSIRDWSNGYRFYTRDAARLLASHEWRYGSPIYLTEALAIWLRARLRIVEFPSCYVGRNEGLSKLRFTDLLKAGIAVFEIGLRYRVTGFAPASRPSLLQVGGTSTSVRSSAVATVALPSTQDGPAV